MDLEPNGLPDNEEIRQLQQEHQTYCQKLDALLQKPYLSEEEQLEEIRLKKLKLYIKDQMVARRSVRTNAFTAA